MVADTVLLPVLGGSMTGKPREVRHTGLRSLKGDISNPSSPMSLRVVRVSRARRSYAGLVPLITSDPAISLTSGILSRISPTRVPRRMSLEDKRG